MKKIFNRYFLFPIIFLFYLVQPTVAQETSLTLTGNIINSETNQPIPFASVGIGRSGIGTSSNAEGKFIIKVPISFKQDTLRVTYVGYAAFRQTIPNIKN